MMVYRIIFHAALYILIVFIFSKKRLCLSTHGSIQDETDCNCCLCRRNVSTSMQTLEQCVATCRKKVCQKIYYLSLFNKQITKDAVIEILHQVLQKSIDYIQYLLQQRRRQEEERNALRKDVVALRIMQVNYEQIVKAQHSVPGLNEQRLTDQDKFQVVSVFIPV